MKYVLVLLGLMMSLGVSLATLYPSCGCYPLHDNYLDCKPLYDVTYDPPIVSEYPMIEICDEIQRNLPRIGGTPSYNVTTREIMIDGIKGTLMNVSRFSNVDDAIQAQKALDPTFPWEYTIDQVKIEWTKFGSLDGKLVEMYAYYNLSDRGDGEYGSILLFPDEIVDQPEEAFQMTPEEMMHAISAIHVIETGE